jgi:hypothetical protein
MRDIRNDLQERADLIQDRIKAARAHFERMVEQLRGEHDARVADLKTSLAMIAKLIEFEQRLIASAPSDLAPPPSPPEQPPTKTGDIAGVEFTNGKRPGVRCNEKGADRSRRPG